MGLRIQLVHPPGESCPYRAFNSVKDFAVLHTNGIHRVRLDFCGCDLGKDIPPPIQLMRRRLWPSTVADPKTATSFEAFDDFTRQSLVGRLTGYDYYKAAVAATDGAGLKDLAVSSRCGGSSLGTNLVAGHASTVHDLRARVPPHPHV